MRMKSKKRDAVKLLICFVVTFCVTGVLLWFIRFPSIRGESMEPTYHDGETVVALHVKQASFNDVVIVWAPDLEEYIVKRVIGVPGDTVQIKEDGLYRNGVLLYETYIKEQGWVTEQDLMEVSVGDGELFLLGDNRLNSKDSREFGMFYISNVFGVVMGR